MPILLLTPTLAMAQATGNPGALDSLSRPQPAPRAATTQTTPARPAPSAPFQPTAAAQPNASAQAGNARQKAPALPTAPPPIASLPPPTPVPVRPAPPAVIPLADDAPGITSPLPSGLRVTFGPDRADLNPTTVRALRQYAATLGRSDNTTVTVMAYAAGAPEDPSTPRRLSLARALAARAVLMDAGVASTRIYPRAMGPAPDLPPDRVDLTRYPPEAAAPPDPASPSPASPSPSRPDPSSARPPARTPPRPAPAR